MSKLYRARSLLYRRQILQENIRWKAPDEIYKICMLLHRSDLNISENFRQLFSHFWQNFAKKKNSLFFLILFVFRAQAVEEALRKDQDCPVEKETPKREREGASGREEAQPPPPGVETWSSSQC